MPRPIVQSSMSAKAHAYRAAAWTITSGGMMNWDTLVYDNWHSVNASYGFQMSGDGRYVCPIAGDYLVIGQFGVAASGAGMVAFAGIYKNGSLVEYGVTVFAAATNNTMFCPVMDIVPCVVGDYLQIGTIGGGNASGAGVDRSYMTVRLVN